MFFCCKGLHAKWVDGSLWLLHVITLVHIFNLVVELGYLFIIHWFTLSWNMIVHFQKLSQEGQDLQVDFMYLFLVFRHVWCNNSGDGWCRLCGVSFIGGTAQSGFQGGGG